MKIPPPLEIKNDKLSGLTVTWPDGAVQNLSAEKLRRQCPCAVCRAERAQDAGRPSSLRIVESSADEQTRLVQIRPVGTYAIALRWGDGHDTGIYSFEYLRSLGSS